MSEELNVNDLIEKSKTSLTFSELQEITQDIIIKSKWNHNISFSPTELQANAIKTHQNLYMDLEIFTSYTQKSEDTIYSHINNTYTSLGNIYLRELLLNPTKNHEILHERQKVIQNICIDQYKYNKIGLLLDQLKDLEKDGLCFWKGITPELKDLLGQVYFQNKYLLPLNRSETILKLYNYFQIIFVPLYGVLAPVLFFIIPYLIVRFFYGLELPFWFYYNVFKSLLFGGSSIGNLMGSNTPSFIVWGQYFVKIISFVFYLYGIYNSFYSAYILNKITNLVHNKVNQLSRFIKTGYQLNMEVYSLFGLDYQTIPIIELSDSLFDTEPYLISNKGKILRTFDIILEHKGKLEPLIQSIGVIDAYYSISKLYKDKHYNFPEYLSDNQKPSITVKELWNPFLDPLKAVKNDIELGNNKPNNIVITGPNASGKSTFIKSLVLSVLLAQTITISPTTNLKITPFQFINTYLNIPDVKGRESLFEAEMNRSKQHIDDVNKLDKNQFSLVVMDEIFNSTNYEEGVAGAYIVAKELGKIPNSISIITTHFPYLTKLNKTGNFLNYKFEVLIEVLNTSSSLKPTYRIKEGSSKQHLALDMLEKKGYDPEVIDEARAIFKELVKMTHHPDAKNKNISNKSTDKPTDEPTNNSNDEPTNNSKDEFKDESIGRLGSPITTTIIKKVEDKKLDLECVIENKNTKEMILEKIQKAVEEKVSKDLSSE
jgi:DNA mismatch repair protein MutS